MNNDNNKNQSPMIEIVTEGNADYYTINHDDDKGGELFRKNMLNSLRGLNAYKSEATE